MRLNRYTARQFADAHEELRPPGAAWRWPTGGFGDSLTLAQSQEFARLDVEMQALIDYAATVHKPATMIWHIDEYRSIANASLNGLTETMPRFSSRASLAKAGQRLWSAVAASNTFNIDLLQVDLIYPSLANLSRAGQRLYAERVRYALRVRYYDTVVNQTTIAAALQAFKQAHVALWFEDITHRAGNIFYA